MNPKKRFFLLLIILAFFALFLFFQESALAGCADQYYYTQCDDKITIGRCCWGSSDGNCCSEHEECEETCDEEGNCTEECHDVCDSWCRECSCNRSWYEYSCGSSVNCVCNDGDPQCCDGDIKRRKCYSKEEGDCSMGSCESESCHFDRCDPSKLCEECQSWQEPIRGGCEGNCAKWGTEKPECKCCGECLEAPTNPRYCMSPSCSETADANNVYLPVKLDWNDVPGWWGGGWSGGGSSIQEYAECQRGYIDFCWDEARRLFEEYKETHPNAKWCQGEWTDEYLTCLRRETKENCEKQLEEEEDDACKKKCPALEEGEQECYDPDKFVKSYKIEITGDLRSCDDGSNLGGYTAVLGISEFFAPCPCFFKSNRTYTWTVKACCTEDGTACQEDPAKQLHASFTTSPAPEPILPADPDWAGPGRAEPNWDTSTLEGYPVELSWCEVEEAVSYIVQAYEWGAKYCPEILCPYCPDCEMLFHKEGLAVPQSFLTFYFGLDSFTKETLYSWEIATCFDEYCTVGYYSDFGQLWKFFGHTTLAKVELLSPKDGDCVNLSSQLEWKHAGGARSYIYDINPVPALQNRLATGSISFKDIWSYLGLNTSYSWQVKPCWDENGADCEEDSQSDEWNFTTTGASPAGLEVTEKDPGTGHALIPIKLNWEDVPCAASYKYEVALDGSFNNIIFEGLLAGSLPPDSEISINYDSGLQHPKQGTSYWWRVKTCADTEGNICGGWASGSFTTFTLREPENPYPPDGGELYTYEHYLKWDPVLGASFYRYELDGETAIVSSDSAFIDTALLSLGTYNWRVRACIDGNCQEAGPSSPYWSFELAEGETPAGKGGIVPCGRYIDNPDTPWNERHPCGIEHIFIMIFSIIDYLLWKIIPIVLALLAAASGVIFYFSGQLGIPDPLTQVKSLWKAAGIGLVVIFLAWVGISLILGLFEYQVGLFGDWWKIEL